MVTGSWGDASGGWSVLVHGGAGDIPEASREAHAKGCKRAASVGAEVLSQGGSALDAVCAAVRALEDDPRFNAGTGACLNEDGLLELDASLMCGETLRAGALAALPPFKNPILIARKVLEDGKHILYVAEGAARFARELGFSPSSAEEMVTSYAREHWERVRSNQSVASYAGGTVGAVARDARGHVACATSTGGTTNKRAGRVGDTPILGAGTWAEDGAGAASGTGTGEAFMRTVLTKTVCDWMREGLSAEQAARKGIEHLRSRTDGTGGLIVMGPRGGLGLARSTGTMSWAAMAGGWPEPRSGV